MGADILQPFDNEDEKGSGVVTLAMNFNSEEELHKSFKQFKNNNSSIIMEPEKTD